MSDPYYNNVSLLLHGNGTNGSTTFTDNSPSPKTLTAFGNAQISTAQSKFGGASMRFDGSGDSLTTPDHAAFEFGAGNFTIEAWVRPGAYATNNNGEYQSTIVCQDTFGQRAFAFNIRGTATSWTELVFLGFSSPTVYTLVTASISLSNSTWYHLAVVRSGNFIYFFVDGVLINAGGSAFSETIQQDITSVLRIGANEFDATYKYYFNGYIDDLRITKGVARYTANFTPPTAAFDDFYSDTVNSDHAVSVEWRGTISADVAIAIDTVAEIIANAQAAIEHGLQVNADTVTPIEMLAGVNADQQIPAEWGGVLVIDSDHVIGFEFRQTAHYDQGVPFEHGLAVVQDTEISLQILAGIQSDITVPYEMQAQIIGDSVISAEWLAQIIASAVVPIEWKLQGIEFYTGNVNIFKVDERGVIWKPNARGYFIEE